VKCVSQPQSSQRWNGSMPAAGESGELQLPLRAGSSGGPVENSVSVILLSLGIYKDVNSLVFVFGFFFVCFFK